MIGYMGYLLTDIKKRSIKLSDDFIVKNVSNYEIVLKGQDRIYRLKGSNSMKYFLPIIYSLSSYNSIESLYCKIEKRAIKNKVMTKLDEFIKLIQKLHEKNIIVFYNKLLIKKLEQKYIVILNFSRIDNIVPIKKLFKKLYNNQCIIFQCVQDYASNTKDITNIFFNNSIIFNLEKFFNKKKPDLVIGTFSSYSNEESLKIINNYMTREKIPWIPYIFNNDKITVGPVFDDFSEKESLSIINEICTNESHYHDVVENSILLDGFYFMTCSMLINECYLVLNHKNAMVRNKIIEFRKDSNLFYYKNLIRCSSGNRNISIEKTKKIINNYNSIEGSSLHDLYHLNSELNNYSEDFIDQIHNAMNEYDFINQINKRKYLNECREQIKLRRINNDELPKKSVFDALSDRRSIRHFSKIKLSFLKFSALLQYSLLSNDRLNYAIDNKLIKNTSSMLFPYPLAGGIRCLDVYVIIKNVESIPFALYKYNDEDHSLILIKYLNSNSISELTFCEGLSENCSFMIYITGDLEKLEYKYGNRAYRFMNLSAGHLAQNIYLAGNSLGLGVVTSGGFKDINIIDYINNEECKYILYEIFVGHINNKVEDPRL